MTQGLGKYVLNEDGTTKLEPDLIKWAEWFETFDRRIAYDLVSDVEISTVFLGLDHSFGEGPEPILFETMTFGGPEAYQERYRTKEEAIRGHEAIVQKVRGEMT